MEKSGNVKVILDDIQIVRSKFKISLIEIMVGRRLEMAGCIKKYPKTGPYLKFLCKRMPKDLQILGIKFVTEEQYEKGDY